MKLPELRHSSSSAEATATADGVTVVNAVSSISAQSSLLFIFFFGGTGTDRESTVCLFLVATTGSPAVTRSLLTTWKIPAIKYQLFLNHIALSINADVSVEDTTLPNN